MSVNAGLPAQPLVWVKGEIERSLESARDQLAQSVAQPADRALLLSGAEVHLRQVRGALQVLGLEGATRFCASMEALLKSFAEGSDKLSRSAVSVIDRGIFALIQFVDDLAKGEPNVPLRLFPVYREIVALAGRANAKESELFFPDLTPVPPVHREHKQLTPDALSQHAQGARSMFQRALLLWLQDPSQKLALQNMRRALDSLDQVADALRSPPGLWWVAAGLIEAITLQEPAVMGVDLKSLMGQIERAMRDAGARPVAGGEALLRELLYPLALAKPVSERVREVRALYRLDQQLPVFSVSGTLEYDMEKLAPQIEDMKKRLAGLEACWVQYTSGGTEGAKQLREQATALKTIASDQGHYRLVKLLEVITLIAAKLPDPYPKQNELLAYEMAAVFLFMENMLDSLTSPPPDIDQQVSVMVGWLLDAVKPRSKATVPAASGLRDDITQRQNLSQIHAQVAREILANMQQVEQIIDAVARNPANREGLSSLAANLHQMSGALTMLDLARAKSVLSACEHLVTMCITAEPGFLKVYLEFIADGLSCLGFYLEAFQRGQKANDDILTGFLERIGPRAAPAAAAAETGTPVRPAPAEARLPSEEEAAPEVLSASSQEQPVAPEIHAVQVEMDAAPPEVPAEPAPAAVAMIEPPEVAEAPQAAALPQTTPGGTLPVQDAGEAERDAEELLQIYIAEAAEVVAGIGAQLDRVRAAPEDREALTAIRRGFHTLKGSGRMVGLYELGEIAWELEQTMNEWLRDGQAVTPAVLHMITRAHEAFLGWVDALRRGAPLTLEAGGELVVLAQGIRAGEPHGQPDQGTEAPRAQAAPEVRPPEHERAPLELEIGNVRLTAALYEIYLREAYTHLATLNAEFAVWSAQPQVAVSREFVRAAHTLKSSSRATGFTAVADLSDLLEQWLRRMTSEAQAVRPIEPIGRAIRALEDLIGEIGKGRAPLPAREELDALQGLIDEAIAAQRQGPPPTAAAFTREPEVPEHEEVHDDLDPQFLPIFVEEAGQLLPQISADLRVLCEEPDQEEAQGSLARALHTLKGSARMAGAMRVGEMTHDIERRLSESAPGGQPGADRYVAIMHDIDRIAASVDGLQAAASRPDRRRRPRAEVEPGGAVVPGVAATLRVDADIIDRLVNQIGEVSIARSRIEGEMDTFKQSLLDLTDSIARMRNQLRETQIQADSQLQSRMSDMRRDDRQFDPLEFDRYTRLQELTRLMAESLHDIATAQQTLLANLGETESALSLQGRVSRDLHQDLLGLRGVPLSLLSERLHRTVRQTARELGKNVELQIVGETLEIDRSVLQRISAPLEHMLRNAIAHGIESPEARRAAGKGEIGHITLSLTHEGNENLLALQDDGAGLNLESIRMEALRSGLVNPGEDIPEARLVQMIFTAGFSTAGEITETSGHGIGMDVVRSEVAAIGGRVEVATWPGGGTRFRVYFPATMAASQAILVRSGGETWAIPSTLVDQVHEAKIEELEGYYAGGKVARLGAEYPFFYLSHLLARGESVAEIKRSNSVLLLRSGDTRAAIHVDQIIKNQEILIKNAGPQLARVPGIAGATVLGNGQVVLIVNPIQLAIRAQQAGALPQTLTRLATEDAARPHVMVVDDSLTVRRFTSRLLTREGYQVSVAKDGVDALQQMQEGLPDLVLADIEMPRMDGLDLTKQLRANPRTADLPIIIVTSRTAEKHRTHAFELGVNGFFGKPYPEDELLAKVAELLGRVPRAEAA